MTDEALPQAINDLRDCWIWTPDRDPNRLTGSPKVDLERCRASVAMDTRWPRWHQCQKKAKVFHFTSFAQALHLQGLEKEKRNDCQIPKREGQAHRARW